MKIIYKHLMHLQYLLGIFLLLSSNAMSEVQAYDLKACCTENAILNKLAKSIQQKRYEQAQVFADCLLLYCALSARETHDILQLRGIASLEQGGVLEAEKFLIQSAKLSPAVYDARTYLPLAKALIMQGHLEAVKIYFESSSRYSLVHKYWWWLANHGYLPNLETQKYTKY